jgi:hypothetical protein
MISGAALLGVLYAVTGPLMCVAYIPQWLSVWRDREGAQAISLLTWALWAASLTVTLCYAIWVNGDALFRLNALLSAVGTWAVLMAACWRRWTYRRRSGRSPQAVS